MGEKVDYELETDDGYEEEQETRTVKWRKSADVRIKGGRGGR